MHIKSSGQRGGGLFIFVVDLNVLRESVENTLREGGNLTDTLLRPNVQGMEEWRTKWGTLQTLHSDQMFRGRRSGGLNGEP